MLTLLTVLRTQDIVATHVLNPRATGFVQVVRMTMGTLVTPRILAATAMTIVGVTTIAVAKAGLMEDQMDVHTS